MKILQDKNIMNKSNKGWKIDRLEDNTIKSNLIINNIETSTNIKEYYVILSILEGYLIANENFLPERTIIPNTFLTFLINGYDRSLIEITSPPISTLIVG